MCGLYHEPRASNSRNSWEPGRQASHENR